MGVGKGIGRVDKRVSKWNEKKRSQGEEEEEEEEEKVKRFERRNIKSGIRG